MIDAQRRRDWPGSRFRAEIGTLRLGRWAADPSWWSAVVQFVGTLLFNLSTFEAMKDGLSTGQDDRLVWAPDLFGSAAFLISGALAFRVAKQSTPARRPPWHWMDDGSGEPDGLRALRNFARHVLHRALERIGP